MAGEEGYTRRDPDQQSGYTRREGEYVGRHRRDEEQPQTSGGFYNPGNASPYDQHSGYTRRYGVNGDGYTRRDPNQHAGYTRRGHGGTRSPNDLKDAEEGGQSKSDRLKGLAANGLSGLLNSEKQGSSGTGEAPFNYVNNGPRFGNARNFLQKHRKKLIASGLAGVGILPIMAMMIFIIAALKIPHFIENMAAWRFAKVTNQYRKTMANVVNEKNAIDSLDDAAREQATAKYGKYAVFDKVNRLRPNKVLQSLNASDRIQYNYKKTLTGRQKLVSITIAPEENPRTKITVKVPTGRISKIIHPFRTLDQYKTISDALNSAMRAHDPKIPTLTRALATRNVLQKAGATLKGMTASKYLGKTDREAKIAITQEAYEKAHRDGGIAGITNENTREVAQEASDEADRAVQDKDQMGDFVDKGQDVPDSVNNIIERGLNPGNLKAIAEKVVGFANPIYDVAVPICMAYDGSKLTPEDVDAQHDSMVSEASFVLSTADQQKDGTTFNTPAANAMNWKLGNIQDSNVIRRVSGKPVNSLDTIGGQRTAMGTYGTTTIFDVFHLGVLNGAANSMCPTLTNFWVGIGIGVVNLGFVVAGSVFTGGAAGAGSISASNAVRAGAEKTLDQIVKKAITTATKKTIKSFGSGGRFAKAYTKSVFKYGTATAAAVYLSQMIVNNKAGLNSGGFEKDVAFADNSDNGAEMLSSDINKANFFARPLNNIEVVQSHRIDRAELAYNNQQLSTFERYLAFDNPNSMISRMAITTGSLLDRSMFASVLNSLANLFNPVGLSSKMFGSLNAATTLAAGNVNTEDYGNVVWAYSQEEQSLMEQDSYTSPSENSLRLEESGKEEEINNKYTKCYESSMGTLLTSGDITRDEDGDVLNAGDCSPEQLGPHNPDYGDLVFRWRLKHAYENTADTLLGIQDPSAPGGNGNTGNLGGIPTGTPQQLAQQILTNGNLSPQTAKSGQAMQHIASTGKASQCGGPAVSSKLLGVVLAAASKYKVVYGVLTDGHNCTDGGFHPMGLAIDINGVNALDGSDGTGRFITKADYNSSKILRTFYTDMGNLIGQAGGGGVGQFDCFAQPLPSKNSNVTYFTGDWCNHLHIDVGKR